MKVIELLNKIANDEIKDKTKFNIYGIDGNGDKVKKPYMKLTYKNGNLLNDFKHHIELNTFQILFNEIEIIEEPKEELEEIELLKTPRMWYASLLEKEDLPLDKECWNRLNSQEDKISELIANQNKIIRELKANNKQ